MIEVLQDLNDQACCCDLTLCPVPVMDCESIEVEAESVGHIDPDATVWKRFKQWDGIVSGVNSFSGGGLTVSGSSIEHSTQKFVQLFNLYIGAGCDYIEHEFEVTCATSGSLSEIFSEPDPPPFNSYSNITTRVQTGGTIPNEGCTWTDTTVSNVTEDGVSLPTVETSSSNTANTTSFAYYGVFTETQTYSDGMTQAEWLAHVSGELSALVSFDYPENCIDAECASSTSVTPEDFTFPFNDDIYASIVLSRVRFQIPSTWADQITGATVAFTGTYFKITYDIIEEPTGWDDAPPTALRSYVSVDNVIEWTGPGSGAADDPSWFTSWITLDPPPAPGQRRIVNIRFICRENWFIGEVPQVTGDATDLAGGAHDGSDPLLSFTQPLR